MNFSKIKIEDKPFFDKLLSLNPYVDCEYLFSTLFMWQDVLGYESAIEENCIYIRHNYKGKMQYHFPICAPSDVSRCLVRIKEEAGSLGEKAELFCVTNEQLDLMKHEEKEHFTAIEERNFSDYLYDGESLRSLAGKRLHKKRNHVAKFTRNYNWSFKIFTETGEEIRQCIDILQKWDINKLENASWQERLLVGNEMNALDKCMKNFTQMGLVGGIIYVDGAPKGFTIGEVAQRGGISTGIVHYEKCDSSYDGIYQAINQMFAQQALSKVQYINRQDDMGVEGLRKAKLSYYPARLVDKFTLKEN